VFFALFGGGGTSKIGMKLVWEQQLHSSVFISVI